MNDIKDTKDVDSVHSNPEDDGGNEVTTRKKRRSRLMLYIISTIAVLVGLGATGAVIYVIGRPNSATFLRHI